MKNTIYKLLCFLGIPLTYFSGVWLKLVTKKGIKGFQNNIFMKLGILPVLDHYYQPLINPKKHLLKSLREDRDLPEIAFNINEQISLLTKFKYNDELLRFPMEKKNEVEFYYNNDSYCSGDAEFLYNIIRHFKPRKIIEIGSGNSTLMACNAISRNRAEDKNYSCQHICIEPFEDPWLRKLDVDLIRKKVESIDKKLFQTLDAGDILFIDSSHIIRPQGDVLFEYLEILPILRSGVLIHIHDIFTPKDYLDEWVYDHYLWNEQYLLEAFLTFNREFRIIGALNYLSHHYREQFAEKCPVFARQLGREPGAFWIVRQ